MLRRAGGGCQRADCKDAILVVDGDCILPHVSSTAAVVAALFKGKPRLMAHTLRFAATPELKSIIAHARAAKAWSAPYGIVDAPTTPTLHLVKDDGIYLMSGATTRQFVEEAGKCVVSYARGYNPNIDGDIWHKTHAVSGDDFVEYLDGSAFKMIAEAVERDGEINLTISHSGIKISTLSANPFADEAVATQRATEMLAKYKADKALAFLGRKRGGRKTVVRLYAADVVAKYGIDRVKASVVKDYPKAVFLTEMPDADAVRAIATQYLMAF